jgi:hypothetical protein
MKFMNMNDARKHAVKRWGIRGKVSIDRYSRKSPSGKTRKMVGVHGYYDWDIYEVYGSGWTWEEAFEKATERGY